MVRTQDRFVYDAADDLPTVTERYTRFDSMSELLTFLTSLHFRQVGELDEKDGAVFIVGSVGRREFIIEHSDIDFVFYGLEEDTVSRLAQSIVDRAKLLLDIDPVGSRQKISDGKLIPSAREKYFPTVGEETLFATETEIGTKNTEAVKRRIQILFEGQPVWSQKHGREIQKLCVEHYDLVNTLSARRLEGTRRLISDVGTFEGEINRTAPTYYGNKAKKYLGLRIPQEMGRRLAILSAVYHKAAWVNEGDKSGIVIELLQRRTINAILFWSHYFPTGKHFSQYQKHLDRLSPSPPADTFKPSEQASLDLVTLCDRAASSHENLLAEYIEIIENDAPIEMEGLNKRLKKKLQQFLRNVIELLNHLASIFQTLDAEDKMGYSGTSLELALEKALDYAKSRVQAPGEWFSIEAG